MSRVALEIDAASPPSSLASEDGGSQQGEVESTSLSFETSRHPRRSTAPREEATSRLSPRPRTTTASVVLRYFSLSVLAVLLTVACPGETLLWHSQKNEFAKRSSHEESDHESSPSPTSAPSDTQYNNYDELQWPIVMRILLSFVATEILFVLVVRSDPGYVRIELMDELNRPSRTEENRDEDPDEEFASASNGSNKESRSLLQGQVGRNCDEPSEKTTMAPSAALAAFESPSRRHPVPLQKQRRQFCDICQLAPPLRAHHCRACNKCVAAFDHHCPLVGNCVGERNRAVFVAFLVVQAAGLALCARVVLSSRLGLATLAFGGVLGGRNPPGLNQGSNDDRLLLLQAVQVIVTKLYVVPIAVTAVVMVISHSVMVACNITTFEIAKSHRLEYLQPYDITECPFSAGVVQNVLRAVHWGYQDPWVPHEWSLSPTSRSNTARADWWNHFCRNDYWSCC